jgi:hypothetical protein
MSCAAVFVLSLFCSYFFFTCKEDQITHLSQVFEDAFQAKKVTLAVFIDLQKAFDKVWKYGLLVKLL